MSSQSSPHGMRLLGKSIALLALTGLLAYGCEKRNAEQAAAPAPKPKAVEPAPVPAPKPETPKEQPKPASPPAAPAPKAADPVKPTDPPKAADGATDEATPPKPKPIPHDELAKDAKAPVEFNIPTGVVVQEFKKGEGDMTLPKAIVTVHFVLYVQDGWKKIQSTYEAGAPETYQLNEVVEGMGDGIVGMKPGAMRRIIVPAARGFGKAGAKDKDGTVIIPPDAVLVYDVDLISNKQKIVDTAPAKPAPPKFNAGRKGETDDDAPNK